MVPGRIRRSARAFTLLEVLVSIGILLLVAGAMFVFYDYALTVRDRTQAATTEAQLARVILDRMVTEIESVSAVTSYVQMRSVRRGFTIQGGNEGVTPDGGMAGSSQRIAYLSSRNIPPGRFVDASMLDAEGGREARAPLYDVSEVNWFWVYDAETGASGGLYRSSRPFVDRPMTEDELQTNVITGEDGVEEEPAWERLLAKRKGETGNETEVEETEQGEDPENPLRVTEQISPEVQWMYMRYYVNGQWQTSFDAGPTPQAVEITLGFAPLLTQEEIDAGTTPAERLEALFDDTKSETEREPLPPHTYQRVVRIPSGEMFSGGGVRRQSRN